MSDNDSSYGSVYVEGVTYIDEREIAKRDAEIERLRNLFIETAAKHEGVLIKRDDEIERLRREHEKAWADAQLKAAEIERLRAELSRLRDQIVKHNISIQEAIRRGEAFEWKTLTLDS